MMGYEFRRRGTPKRRGPLQHGRSVEGGGTQLLPGRRALVLRQKKSRGWKYFRLLATRSLGQPGFVLLGAASPPADVSREADAPDSRAKLDAAKGRPQQVPLDGAHGGGGRQRRKDPGDDEVRIKDRGVLPIPLDGRPPSAASGESGPRAIRLLEELQRRSRASPSPAQRAELENRADPRRIDLRCPL